MRNIKIEVFEDDAKEATIKIPVAVLSVASNIFPKKYISSLESNDVSLSDLIHAASSPDVAGNLIEIEDHKDNTRVIISVI